MGPPVKVMLAGQAVFLCCDGCKKPALAKPQATLAKLEKIKKAASGEASTPQEPVSVVPKGDKIANAIAKLSPEDQALAKAQGYCVVIEQSRLGSMGTPVKVMIEGKPVFLCCDECTMEALADHQGA